MSVSATGSHAFSRFQALMKDVNTTVESRHGKNVTAPQADKIIKEFEQLKGAEKLAAATALKAFLQNDVFSVTDGARTAFAKALGVDAASLKPTAAAGGTVRNVMQHGLKLMAGAQKVDAAMLKELFGSLKGSPKEIGDFLTSSIKKAGETGDLKLDPEARKEYVKEFASRNANGAVDYLSNKFGEEFANKVPDYMLKMLSTPPLFEELIFLLMITLVSDTQKEVLEEQARIQKAVDTDQKTAKLKEDDQKAIDAGLAKKAQGGGAVNNDPIKFQEYDPKQRREMINTKAKLESFVAAVDANLRDDGKIDKGESKSLVSKLDRSFPEGHPVRKALAEAIGTAIEHSKVPMDSELAKNMQPFMDWAKKASGLETFPLPTEAQGKSDIAKALLGSDKPELRLAGFLADSFIAGNALQGSQQDTVQKSQPMLQELVSAKDPGSAANVGTEGVLLSRMQRIVDVDQKLRAKGKTIDTDKAIGLAVQRELTGAPPEQVELVTNACQKAFAALPKDKPATGADVEKAYREARNSLVGDVLKDDPVVQAAEEKLLGRGVDTAIAAANDAIKNREDSGNAPLTKEQKGAVLEERLGVERQQLIDEAKAGGYTDAQAEALGQAFDVRADQVRARFAKSGKVEPESKNGMGSESVDPTESNDTRSRQIMFEQLKFKMNMLSEMMQSMSNILNTMHQNAENTIRAIR